MVHPLKSLSDFSQELDWRACSQSGVGGTVTRKMVAGCRKEEQRANHLKRYAGEFFIHVIKFYFAYLLLTLFFGYAGRPVGSLVPQSGIKPVPPCIGSTEA